MKKLLAFTVFILISFMIISGCSPMAYDDLSSGSEGLYDTEDFNLTASDQGEYIQIVFSVITDAKSYGYGVSSSNVAKIADSDLTYSDGYYTANIAKDSEIFSSSGASRSVGTLSFNIYASPSTSPSSWILIKSVDVDLTISTAPDMKLSDRQIDSVVIEANTESISGGMTYRITNDSGINKEITSSELPYTLTGIGSSSQTLTISHKYTGTSSYSDLTQTLTVAEYDLRQVDIDVAINLDGSVTVSDLPSGSYSAIGLYEVVSDGSLSELNTIAYDGSGGNRTFSSDTFGEGYYAGNIRVAIYKSSVNDEDALLSSILSYETDFDALVKANERIGKQSYSVAIPVSDKMDISSVSVSGNSNITATYSDGYINITSNSKKFVTNYQSKVNNVAPEIGTLESRTSYAISLIINSDYGRITKSIPFTTDSFAGNYKWSSSGMDFSVIVAEPTNSNSSFNYYIYFNSDDPVSKDRTDLRISPLVDYSVEEEFKTCAYSEAPEAYQKNNEKWNSLANSSLGKVKEVSSIENNVTNSKDIISSTVTSLAEMFSMKAITQTDFSLIETIDGQLYLSFFNKIIGGGSSAISTGNGALNKNGSPSPEKYEGTSSSDDDREYYYTLSYQGNN